LFHKKPVKTVNSGLWTDKLVDYYICEFFPDLNYEICQQNLKLVFT